MIAAVAMADSAGVQVARVANTEPTPAPHPRTGTKSPQLCTVEEAMERTGTNCPSAARKRMQESSSKRISYMPHAGAKQRAKALKRAQP